MTRASDAKLEGIVEEQREGRGEEDREFDARVGFPTEIARGIASAERGKRAGNSLLRRLLRVVLGRSFLLAAGDPAEEVGLPHAGTPSPRRRARGIRRGTRVRAIPGVDAAKRLRRMVFKLPGSSSSCVDRQTERQRFSLARLENSVENPAAREGRAAE